MVSPGGGDDVLAVKDLDLRLLLTLSAVVAEGTFGRAATRLGYTQSAVSQQVAALERVVGEPVFDRPGGPRRPTLTPVGRLLAEHAADLLERAEACVAAVGRFQAGAVGRLDVGTFESISTAVLPALLSRLHEERPGLQVGLVESDDDTALAEQVVEGRLDLTFLTTPPPDGLEGVDLFLDPFVVVARPQDVVDGPVPASTLAAHPLIGQHDNACQRLVDDGLRAVGVTPDYVFRTSDNSAVTAMVRAGVGMAVLPLLAIDAEDPRTIVRDVDPPLPHRHVHLAWARGRTPSPTARRFVELAVDGTAHRRGPAV